MAGILPLGLIFKNLHKCVRQAAVTQPVMKGLTAAPASTQWGPTHQSDFCSLSEKWISTVLYSAPTSSRQILALKPFGVPCVYRVYGALPEAIGACVEPRLRTCVRTCAAELVRGSNRVVKCIPCPAICTSRVQAMTPLLSIVHHDAGDERSDIPMTRGRTFLSTLPNGYGPAPSHTCHSTRD